MSSPFSFLIERHCPSFLDTLIGIEEAGFFPFMVLGSDVVNFVQTRSDATVPPWLERGIHSHIDNLRERLRRFTPEQADHLMGKLAVNAVVDEVMNEVVGMLKNNVKPDAVSKNKFSSN